MKKTLWFTGLAVMVLATVGYILGLPQTPEKSPMADTSATPAQPGQPSPSLSAQSKKPSARTSALTPEDLAKLAAYEQWLEDNLLLLQGMPMLERQTALWEKREELFGDDASRIWGERESPMHANQDAFQAELQRLNQAHDITPEETAHQLKTTVEELYNNDMARQLIGPDVMARTLFSLESVQSHLHTLSADARQARINSLRRQMGYPEDALIRLEQQDQKRNERWQNGKAYMAERAQLARRHSGEHLDEALDELRAEHFGRSAKTIALEEQDGFFRFERERRFGVN